MSRRPVNNPVSPQQQCWPPGSSGFPERLVPIIPVPLVPWRKSSKAKSITEGSHKINTVSGMGKGLGGGEAGVETNFWGKQIVGGAYAAKPQNSPRLECLGGERKGTNPILHVFLLSLLRISWYMWWWRRRRWWGVWRKVPASDRSRGTVTAAGGHLESLLITRIRAAFSSLRRWLSAFRSDRACEGKGRYKVKRPKAPLSATGSPRRTSIHLMTDNSSEISDSGLALHTYNRRSVPVVT